MKKLNGELFEDQRERRGDYFSPLLCYSSLGVKKRKI